MKTLHVGVGSLLLLMAMLHAAEAAVVEYDWDVDYVWGAPDCVEKLILAVNGQYPSPTIRAVEGDTVVVKVTNHIPTEGVVFHWHGMHQSLLIEGRGHYSCSLFPVTVPPTPGCLTCNATSPRCAPHVIPVTPGKTYRLRIASVASLSSLNFILEGHKMTVVQADGRYIKPFDVYNLDVYSGQSYDVLFTANQDASKNYWAAINVRGRNPETPTGLAVVQYLPNAATALPATPAPVSPVWNDTATSIAQARELLAKVGYEAAPPKKSDRTIVILGTQNNINGNLKWALNNISYVHQSTPVIAALKYKIKGVIDSTSPPDHPVPNYNVFFPPKPSLQNAKSGSPLYVFKKGSVVDVIVQNANTLTPNNSEIHPWHLHGHDFWVLGYGQGLYDPKRDAASFNLLDPPVRNTAAVFPYGWVALRFVADNPGAWPFHCHIESHFHMGMGTVFAEGVHNLPNLPTQTLGCGLTKRHL